MKEIDLDKLKSAWKTEQSFDDEKLSRERITAFMSSASKSIEGLFRRSLIFDITVKALLAFSSGALMVLYSDQGRVLPVLALLIVLVVSSVILQIRIYLRIPSVKDSGKNARSLLHSYISFYSRSFIPSLITASLTGPLVFVIGSLFYSFLKYGTIGPLEFVDFLVLGSMVAISFLLGAFAHIKNFNFHIGQLKDSLAEIEQDTLTESRLNYYKKNKYRNLIIYSIILVVGLLLFLLLLLKAG